MLKLYGWATGRLKIPASYSDANARRVSDNLVSWRN